MTKKEEYRKEFLFRFNHLWLTSMGSKEYKKENWLEVEKEIKELFKRLDKRNK